MPGPSPDSDEPDFDLDIDVRSVAVIWDENGDIEVTFTGSSAFEAIGLLRVALRKLEDEFALPLENDEPLEDDE